MTTSVDAVALVDSSQADYVFIVQSRAGQPWCRLIRRDNKQVLYAGPLQVRFEGPNLEGAVVVVGMRSILSGAGVKFDR